MPLVVWNGWMEPLSAVPKAFSVVVVPLANSSTRLLNMNSVWVTGATCLISSAAARSPPEALSKVLPLQHAPQKQFQA